MLILECYIGTTTRPNPKLNVYDINLSHENIPLIVLHQHDFPQMRTQIDNYISRLFAICDYSTMP